MTVLDFRSGGYADSRDGYVAQDDDAAHAAHWHSQNAGPRDWQAGDDWDDPRYAADPGGARLRDRDGVLGRVARLTHYLGALVSVGLMVALAVWGYQLVVRDVSGVPVIRAVEGEARIAPDEPGGELTARTGLAVNSVSGGVESAPVDKVAIAPAPTSLDGQDVAMGQLGATAHAPTVTSDEPVAESVVALNDTAVQDQAAAGIEAAGVPAVPAMEADAIAASSAVTDAAGQPTQDTAITAALAEAGAVPSVTTATRPLPRPRRFAAAAASTTASDAMATAPLIAADQSASEAAPAEAPAPVPAVNVASGAPLVQIGAFDSGPIAQSEWSRVSGRYGDLFSGKSPVVQEHKVGGRTFYRLRVAGFDSRDDARKFCAALIAAGTDCIPAAAK